MSNACAVSEDTLHLDYVSLVKILYHKALFFCYFRQPKLCDARYGYRLCLMEVCKIHWLKNGVMYL